MSTSESPFGAPSRAPRARLLRAGAALAALAGAGLGAWALTRDAGAAPAAGGHAHDHGAAPAAGAQGPVALAPRDERRIGITYAAATVAPLGSEVRTVGQVTVDETRVRAVAPRIDGWVERLYVDYTGRPVRAGEPLLAIYSPMLVAAQEELLLARRLARDVAGGTDDAARGADDLVAAARRRLALWEIPESEIARIESTGEVRRTLTLRAPASGVVTQKRVVAGQRVMAGDALFEIVDLATVWVEGDVYEQDLARVRVGQRVIAELHALPGAPIEGRVDYVYPTLDPETRTARIRVALPNPARRLMPGMAATLHVLDAAEAPVLGVPRSAVLSTGERDLVFVRRPDGKLEPREVTLGAAGGDRIEILRGLAAGETVVASATFLVDAESNLGAAMDAMADAPAGEPAPATGAAPAPAAGGANQHRH